ncbi:MAG: hypothetical protein LBQ43_02290, partial [Holosporales bacterium]|nr:hypothetical protein [Holosporales bacterium]
QPGAWYNSGMPPARPHGYGVVARLCDASRQMRGVYKGTATVFGERSGAFPIRAGRFRAF